MIARRSTGMQHFSYGDGQYLTLSSRALSNILQNDRKKYGVSSAYTLDDDVDGLQQSVDDVIDGNTVVAAEWMARNPITFLWTLS